MPSRADLGKAIVFLADMIGLSQKQLAAKVGVHKKTISAWSRGERSPRPANMDRVLLVLRCSRADLDEVAAYHGRWRGKMEHASQTASSVAPDPAAVHPIGDEVALEIGRALVRVHDLLSSPRQRKDPPSESSAADRPTGDRPHPPAR